MSVLKIGTKADGKPFTLPLDAAVQTFAIMGIRGSGKTSTACVLAEEMCRANLPWIAFDPVGVWWGLRANRDGKAGGHPVVVFGGQHADLPLHKNAGAQVAEALVNEAVWAVIDLSQESKRFWHTFVTDFCLRLMSLNPAVPRHLFIEEAPEFAPQRTKVDLTARCKEAVERLVRLGRNRGYGCSLISQRPATVDKDVLSQCENIFVLRTVGAHDRKALYEWLSEKQAGDAARPDFPAFSSLPSGTAYFWSPSWLQLFERIQVRERETFHPGATRKIGRLAPQADAMADVGAFVEKLGRQFAVIQAKEEAAGILKTPKGKRLDVPSHERMAGELLDMPLAEVRRLTEATANGGSPVTLDDPRVVDLDRTVAQLRQEILMTRAEAAEANRRLVAVRKVLEPQFLALKGLFALVEISAAEAGTVDRGIYEPWLAKAGQRGARRRMLEVMIERREATRSQLATLASISPRSGPFRSYLSWLKTNGLVNVEGEMVRLQVV